MAKQVIDIQVFLKSNLQLNYCIDPQTLDVLSVSGLGFTLVLRIQYDMVF